MVEEGLAFPRSIAAYFDSAHSPLNPYNTNHNSFVYGTLPLFVTKAVGALINKKGYDGSYLVGRVLSGLFDLFTVWLTYLLARRFAHRSAALLAAALMAFCPLAIQLSHYWTVDAFLTAFVTATLLGAVRIARGRSAWKGDVITALALGLAVGCKVTALALFAPVGIALVLDALAAWTEGHERRRAVFVGLLGRGLVVLVVALVTIRVALPYSFLGLRLDPRYVADMKSLMAVSKSVAGFPPALQWAGRTILFPIKNFVLWGAGPFFGLTALAAFVWAAFAAWKRERRALLTLMAFAAIICAYHGLIMVKSIRYFYPAYPVFAVLCALVVTAIARRFPERRLARWLPGFVAAGTVLAGLALSSIYSRPHTRVKAARWIYRHIPPPARIGNESWDDGQPLNVEGHSADPYAGPSFELWSPDNPAKVEALLKTLDRSDWIAITSNRVFGNITRLPMVYPMTTAYYRALFEERLGFERAAEFASYPSLGPLVFPDDGAEEQFTVYDHPRVLLFRKTNAFSIERARSILSAALTKIPPTIWEWEKLPRSQRKVEAPLLPARGTRAASLPQGEAKIPSVPAAILFYAAITAIGGAAFPLAFLLFPRLSDRGFGFARVLGLILATYLLTLGVTFHAARNGRGTAALCAALLGAAGAAAFAARRQEILAFLRENRRRLLTSEALFAFGFLFFLAVRAFAPEIYSGEKPMDFSILNILARTETLPASDPWFSGAPLRYYTLGQQTIAGLSLLTGLSTRLTFNLAFGFLGGATLQAAFALLFAWTGRLRTGLYGAGLTGLLANLSGLREWLVFRRPKHLSLDWNYFWATSRVVPDTINEYPLWSLIFADLHAHVFAFPLFFLIAACALQLTRAHADPASRLPERLRAAALLGFAAAAQVLTNAWDTPLLAGLLLLVPIVLALAPGAGLAATGRALLSGIVAIATAVIVARPVFVAGGSFPGWGRNNAPFATGVEIANVFGLFFFLLLGWFLVAMSQRGGEGGSLRRIKVLAAAGLLVAVVFVSPIAFCAVGVAAFLAAAILLAESSEDRLAFGFAGTAFFLIAFAQRFYIYDRMNTYFKLFLEAWMLFAVASAALVFGRRERRGAWDRWPATRRIAAGGLVGLALFTAVMSVRGYLVRGRPLPPGAASTEPTLDGLAYLERWRPGEYKAVAWLRENVRGTPVVLEAHGPSYQEFGRISAYTGLPTVLGWDYHVQQRGNADTAGRAAAVEAIYTTPSPEIAEGLLRRYHVGYVYVGRLEQTTYPPAGLAKFDDATETFPLVYENPEVRIYRVAGGDTQDVIVATRETLPPAQTPAAETREPEEPEEAPSIASKPVAGAVPFSDMKEPRDAAVDERGRVWVADFGSSRLRVFDAQGGHLGGWGGRGNGAHGFNQPCGVAIRGDDLYVADTWNGRIEFFTLGGERKAVVSELYGPRGVAVAPDGTVWVADTGNNRLIAYDRQLQNPRVFGKKGSQPGEFSGPVGVVVGKTGLVYVADAGNRRVQVLDDQGRWVRSWPMLSWGDGAEPQIEVDEDERVYVTDPSHDSVLEFDRNGAQTARLTVDSAGKSFSRPTGLALNPKRRIIYVVNAGNNSITTIRLPDR